MSLADGGSDTESHAGSDGEAPLDSCDSASTLSAWDTDEHEHDMSSLSATSCESDATPLWFPRGCDWEQEDGEEEREGGEEMERGDEEDGDEGKEEGDESDGEEEEEMCAIERVDGLLSERPVGISAFLSRVRRSRRRRAPEQGALDVIEFLCSTGGPALRRARSLRSWEEFLDAVLTHRLCD